MLDNITICRYLFYQNQKYLQTHLKMHERANQFMIGLYTLAVAGKLKRRYVWNIEDLITQDDIECKLKLKIMLPLYDKIKNALYR